jgi:hypothetical protein
MQPFDEAIPNRRSGEIAGEDHCDEDRAADRDRIPLDFGFASAQVNPLLWHRLVDGVLSEDEYRQMLVKLEMRPELWRDCALAFLEDQALKKALAGLGAGEMGEASGVAVAGNSAPPVSAAGEIPFPVAEPPRRSAPLPSLESGSPSVARTAADWGGSWNRRPARGLGQWSTRDRRRLFGRGRWAVPLLTGAAGFLLAFATFGQWSDNSPSRVGLSGVGLNGGNGATGSLGGEPFPFETELYGDLLANLSPSDLAELFAKASQRKVRSTVQATPAVVVPGEVKADRRFLFYRDQDGNSLVLPVDDYQYVARDFQ